MSNTTGCLRRASRIYAPHSSTLATLISDDLATARGTMLGHCECHLITTTLLGNRTDYLGNNFTRLTNYNGVTDTDITIDNKLCIMKSRSRNGSSGKSNRLEVCSRCKNTCSADLKVYRNKLSFLFLGRIFIGNSPLWSACSFADFHTVFQVVNLNNRTVHIKRKLVAMLTEITNVIADRIISTSQNSVRNGRKSKAVESVKGFDMSSRLSAVQIQITLLKIKDEYFKPS